MEIDILDKNVVHKILFEANSWQNKKRKEKEWAAYQIKEGMVREYVKEELKQLFPKNHLKMRVSDINVTKKVVDKLSKSYAMSPQRELPNASKDVNENLNSLYKSNKFNMAFRNFDWIYNLHKYCLFWVNYDAEMNEYRPQALKPFEYDVIRDANSGDLQCVILSYPDIDITRNSLNTNIPVEISDGINQLIQESQFDSGAEAKVFALWTPIQHAVVVWQKKSIQGAAKKEISYSVTYVPIDGNPQNVNPLGALPFVYLQKSDAADYPTHNPLSDQTINFNVFYSDMLTSATMQGFGQAVLKYPEGAEIKEIEIGYMNAVKLPQSQVPDAPPTDFTYVNASPDLAGQQKVYLTYLKQVLAEHGITGAQSIDGENEKFTSGLDRLIANADVQWLIQDNQEQYLDVENEVFDIVKMYEAMNGNFEFQDFEEIKVIYQKPTVQISDSEKLNNIKMLLDMNLKSRAQALMILDPNLSEQQSEEMIAKLDQGKRDMFQLFSLPKDVTQQEEAPLLDQGNNQDQVE